MNKHTDVYNVLDVKNSRGVWLKSYRPVPFVQHHTRAGILWNSINYRVNNSESYGSGTYSGCKLLFKDFQELAEWCQDQYGYMNKNSNNTFWPIDKDLLVPGSNLYSPDTCMFVPQKVNSCFTLRQNHRGAFPIGVIFHKRDKIYEATCNDGSGKGIYLGRTHDPIEAHMLWIKKKIEIMQSFLEDSDISQHEKLIFAINNKIEMYQTCIQTNTEVKF